MIRVRPKQLLRPILLRGPHLAGAGLIGALCTAAFVWEHLWARRMEEVGAGRLTAQQALHSMVPISVSLGLALIVLAGLPLGLWLVAKQRSANRNARFRAVLEQSPNGMLIADATSFRILDANPALQHKSEYSLEELHAMDMTQLFSADDCPDMKSLYGKLREPDPRLPLLLRQRCKSGAVLDVEAVGHRMSMDGRAVLAYTTTDVTLRRKIEAQLLEKQQHLDHLAHHDQLTGLPNRLYLQHYLPGAIENARRSESLLAVLFLDLDRFKHINDSRGHEVGDKLLKTVAQRVRATVRKDDVVVRMGGDEFVVVLPAVKSLDVISLMAARITDTLSAPVLVDGRPLVTTVSIGVSLFPRDGKDMGELLRHSDTAMYQAKDRGRNNYQLFSPIMASKLRERVAIETSLRTALAQNHLDVHYQPIVDIESNRVMALEALVRWKHPSHGLIPPERFIGVAEETGLIVPVGEFVLNRVAEDLAHWRKSGATTVPIAVNISAVQLQRSNLPRKIESLAREYGLSPKMVQLELTESAMFERREGRGTQERHDAISQLRELGVRIAIDDFGTGYSSLSYLKRWPVDYLKIDRSFVRDLVTDMSDLAIVGAIVAIARHMNITVVAEGIEGWQQLEKLRQLGCEQAQGYLFAKPAPAAACTRHLTGEQIDLTEVTPLIGELDATGS